MINRGTLVVMSHPDDESLWVGGAIASRVQRGIPVDVACCTLGESGKVELPPGLGKDSLALIRVFELYRACLKLGVRHCFIKGFPDGKLKEKNRDLQAYLALVIQKLKPREIITFGLDGITGHRDHIILHKIMTKILREAEPGAIESLKYVVIPRDKAKEFKLKYRGIKAKGLIKEDVSKFLNLKKQAIACHLSQLPGLRALLPRDEDSLNQFLSIEYFWEESI